MAASLLECLLFGITLAAAVGPIALLIMSFGARAGTSVAARAGCGAALADFLYALLAFLASSAVLERLRRYEVLIHVGGGLVLLVLAVWMLQSALRLAEEPEVVAAPAPPGARRPFLTTLALTLVNPLTIAVFAGFAAQLPLAGSPARALLLAAGVGAGSLAVQLGFASAGVLLARVFARPARARLLQAASGLGIMAFGIHGLLQA